MLRWPTLLFRWSAMLTGLLLAHAAFADVATRTIDSCLTPTITAANSYGINFVMGGKLIFANALGAKGTGRITGVSLTIKKLESIGFTLTTFTSDPANSTWTDAAVAAINAADIPFARTVIPLTSNNFLGATGVTVANDALTNFPIAIIRSGTQPLTSIWGILTTNAALTTQLALGDVTICVQIDQDQ
jgi:hypothetical protein